MAKDQGSVKKTEANGDEEGIDGGWEMASGNKMTNNVSSRIIERSDIKPLKKLNHYAAVLAYNLSDKLCKDVGSKSDKIKAEQIKSVQKVRLKNTSSLPNDFRSGSAKNIVKKEIPKYTILRRSPDQIDIRNIIENSEALRPLVKNIDDEYDKCNFKDSNCGKIIDTESHNETTIKNGKLLEVKKQGLARARSNPICGSDRALKTVPEKLDQTIVNSSWTSQKKFVKTPGSTPSASPKAKRSPNKRHAKHKSIDFSSSTNLTNVQTEKINPTVPDQSQVNPIGAKDEGQVFKRRERIALTEEKIELKKPSMKLLRSGRKRTENVIITGSMIFRVAQIAGVLLLLYVIIIF